MEYSMDRYMEEQDELQAVIDSEFDGYEIIDDDENDTNEVEYANSSLPKASWTVQYNENLPF